MYSDPSQIQRHKYSFTLNDAEKALIDAVIGYTGGQRQPLLRELVLDQAQRVLNGEGDLAPDAAQNEEPTSVPDWVRKRA